MPGSRSVSFASSNRHKFGEARRILEPLGIRIRECRITIPEIQSHSIEEISRAKADRAYQTAGGPVLVEDDGLFIESLGGFPGPYSSYAFDTIGNRGILALVGERRDAVFRSAVSYRDGDTTATFSGKIWGTISDSPRGYGWGYDPIFVPRGARGTFAQIDKDAFSHRREALAAFAEWYHAAD